MAEGGEEIPIEMSKVHGTVPEMHFTHHRPADLKTSAATSAAPEQDSPPISPRVYTPNPFSRKNTSLDLDDYFTGPRDLQRHSKWPMFFQMHGSILPKMIVPLIGVACWATLLTCIHELKRPIGVSSILLTILGFVVSLGLSFRSSTAYERYGEGRRYWAQLILSSQGLARVFWLHTIEREGELGQKDLLAKLSALNLIIAYAVALKHKLRFEPYTQHDDLVHLISHLDTFAQAATREEPEKVMKTQQRHSAMKSTGEYLGVTFAASNPRKFIKQAERPLGNLPLEILSYLASYTDEIVANGQLKPIPLQTMAFNTITSLNDVMVGTERVLTTPLPIAYAISITQITWVYIMLLPFQLLPVLDWITIPAAVAAAYIILGLLLIGHEIENPFGQDVNDLPLESYCAQIATEIDVIASKPRPRNSDWIESSSNRIMWPLSHSGWHVWVSRDETKVREAVKAKVEMGFEARQEAEAIADGNGPALQKVKSRKSGPEAV